MVEERPLSLSGTTQPKGPERVDFQPLDWTSLSDGQSRRQSVLRNLPIERDDLFWRMV